MFIEKGNDAVCAEARSRDREKKCTATPRTHSRGAAAPVEKKEEYSSVCVPFLLCGRVRDKLFHLLGGRVGAELGLQIQVNAPYMSSPNGPRGPPKTPILCLTLTNNFKKKLLSIRVM